MRRPVIGRARRCVEGPLLLLVSLQMLMTLLTLFLEGLLILEHLLPLTVAPLNLFGLGVSSSSGPCLRLALLLLLFLRVVVFALFHHVAIKLN